MLGTLFDTPSLYFTVPGLLGLVFVIGKTLLTLLGVDTDDPGSVDVATGADGAAHGGGVGLLSLQSVMAFLMGFGWAGLLALHPLKWPVFGAIGLGAVVGVGLVFLQAAVWRALFGLQSSGNIEIRQAAGLEGVVYVQVPGQSKGQGQVRVIIDGRQRTFNAVTPHAGSLESQTRVRVVRVNADNTLTVEPAA